MRTILGSFKNTAKHWYISLIVGILLLGLGIYMFFVPAATYLSMVILFSTWFFILGILELFFAVQNKNTLQGWGWYLAGAILDLVVGTILIFSPAIAAIALPLFIGFTLLFRSAQGIGFAFDLKNGGIKNWGYLLFSSILTLIFSVLMLMDPIFAGISVVVLTAMSFIFAGITAVILSFQLKSLKTFPISKALEEKIKLLEKEYEDELKS